MKLNSVSKVILVGAAVLVVAGATVLVDWNRLATHLLSPKTELVLDGNGSVGKIVHTWGSDSWVTDKPKLPWHGQDFTDSEKVHMHADGINGDLACHVIVDGSEVTSSKSVNGQVTCDYNP